MFQSANGWHTAALSIDGSGGTYFLLGPRRKPVACFKPCDEEPGCHNNPRGLVGIGGGFGLRAGIAAGEASQREVAAYVEEKRL